MKILNLIFYTFILVFTLNAQDVIDTTVVDPVIMEKVEQHSPRKATILSAVLPGAGQIYNKKYWKLPILYGGFAAVGYAIHWNQDRYITYKDALAIRIDGNEETIDNFEEIYSEENLRTLKDFYRRNRDLSIIIGGIVYVLNILDAHIDAHLFYFDVTDDLGMKISPVIIENKFDDRKVPGLGFTFNLN